MKTTTEKRAYRSPQIERITLDSEISLALSSPENLPLWSSIIEVFNNDLNNINTLQL